MCTFIGEINEWCYFFHLYGDETEHSMTEYIVRYYIALVLNVMKLYGINGISTGSEICFAQGFGRSDFDHKK